MVKAILIDNEVHCLDTMNMLVSGYCHDVHIMEQCVCAKMDWKQLASIKLILCPWILKCL